MAFFSDSSNPHGGEDPEPCGDASHPEIVTKFTPPHASRLWHETVLSPPPGIFGRNLPEGGARDRPSHLKPRVFEELAEMCHIRRFDFQEEVG